MGVKLIVERQPHESRLDMNPCLDMNLCLSTSRGQFVHTSQSLKRRVTYTEAKWRRECGKIVEHLHVDATRQQPCPVTGNGIEVRCTGGYLWIQN